MILRIKHWLAPPVFKDDENKTRRANLLNHVLLTILVLVLCIIAGNLAGGRIPALVNGLNVLVVVLVFILRQWNQQGRFGLAGGALMAIGLVVITLVSAILGTIRTPTSAIFILLVVTAGLLFDLGGMITMTVLCSLAVAGLIVAENVGLLPRPDYTVTITQWISYTILFVWAGSLTFYAIQSMRQALAHADKEITQRKQTEDELRKSEERFRKLIETEPECVKLLTKESILIDMNPAGLRMIEADSSEQVVGQSVLGIIDPEYREAFKDLVRRIFNGESAILEFRITGLRGTKRWLETHAVPVFDDNGKINLLLSITRDITGRKRAEEALQESEALLSNAFNNSPLIMTISDLSTGKYLEVNDSFCTVSEYNRDEVIGKTSIELGLISEEEREGIVYELQRHGKVAGLELPIRSKNGKTVIWRISGDVIHTAKGYKLFSAAEDITERKLQEEELKKYRDHLEELVRERTIALEIARDRAEDSDKLKSAFLATMSHELRTPLNSIIGFTGIILDGLSGPINDEQKKQMNMVKNSSKHLLSLIQDILDVSKIESGQLKINIAIFDIHKAIDITVGAVKHLANEKGLMLNVEVTPQEIPIQSDQRRVEQIISNLLINAIKFTEKGEVKVECFVSDGKVITRVIDTGIGIKPEHMDRLFKPFIQLDDRLSRRFEGTGLGLSICKKFVEMLGGSISAQSEYGKGSIFTFTLPLLIQKNCHSA